jgi:glycine/D-amino acid oxidase-like deaminating enzyme
MMHLVGRGPRPSLVGQRRHRSLWMQQVAGDHPDAPPLVGHERADIAIVGGGFVGLWTALEIKSRQPNCAVVVVERDVCGGGASGANGGMVLTWWAKFETLAKFLGIDEALRLAAASASAIDEVGAFCAEHRIDAEFHRAGWLWTATTPAQLGAWERARTLTASYGHPVFEPLSAVEVARRSGSAVHWAGVFERSAAVVHPAKLVRGLRRVALERGVRIYEHSPVWRLGRRHPPVIYVRGGRVVADKVIVATNAWATAMPDFHRRIAVISSDVVATAPVPERLDAIGWRGGESISDSQLQVHYYRRTDDGRLVLGKGGWGIAFAGHIGRSMFRHERRAREVTRNLRRIYPDLADVPVTHDWSGPIDRTANGLPLIGHLGGRRHVLYGVGWSGNGVGPSRLGARMLAAMACESADEWSSSPLIDLPPSPFPPEPIRYVGAHIVRSAVVAKERAEETRRTPGRIATAVASLAPAGITPTRARGKPPG